MRFRRTLTAVLAALGMSLGLSMVAAPAFAASPTAVFTKVSDWGTGFEAKYTVTNGAYHHHQRLVGRLRPAPRRNIGSVVGRAR